jgi:hypothetical protein
VRLWSWYSWRQLVLLSVFSVLLGCVLKQLKMAMEAVYCLCGQPYDCNKFMIQCDICKDWFHGRYLVFCLSFRDLYGIAYYNRYSSVIPLCEAYPCIILVILDQNSVYFAIGCTGCETRSDKL